MAFNGHAHGYQRNKPDSAGLVSYVLGNGGAALGPVSGCSSTDLYAIGSSGTHCGAAPPGLTNDHVYGFAKVTVNGRQVTVTPTDELGHTYDIQTYTFPGSEPDNMKPTPPTTVTAVANTTAKVTVSWSGATDNVGVTGYRVFRDGAKIDEVTGSSYVDTTVSPDSSYSYRIVALDAAGNSSDQSAAATASTTGAPDGTAPTQPGGLSGTAVSSSQVNLAWTASTDNVGVTGYKVYRNGTLQPGPTQPDPNPPTSYSDQNASPGTTYTYQVSAVDAAGNESTKASTTVTTPGSGGTGTLTFAPSDDVTLDSSRPTTNLNNPTDNVRITVDNSPQNYALLKFTVAGTNGCAISSAKLRLTVGNTTNDNSPYGGDVYGTTNTWTESGVTWNTAPAAGTKAGSVATTVNLSTSYLFDVKPLVTGDGTVSFLVKSTNSDGARYYSKESGTAAQAPQLQVTCGTGGGGDVTAPTSPGNLTATPTSSSRVDLNWTASTDDVGVTGYKVYRDSSATPLATLSGTTLSYADTTVSASTMYTYQVSALDAAGHESPKSNVSVTTPSGSGTGTFTFAATEDATVDSSQPTVNLNGSSRLTVDNSPQNYALLKFPVTGTTGCTITSAKLRLTVGSGTDDKSVYGGDVYGTSSGWSQTTVTWNTAPAAGTKAGSVTTAVAANTSYLFDVKPLVTGDGTVSFLVKSTNSDGARYYTRETGTTTTAPQLQVTCG
jgi:fibronectin type 3 domain-containing protein